MREPGRTLWRKKWSGILRHLCWQASWLYSVRIDQDAAGGLGLFSAVYHQIGRRWADRLGKTGRSYQLKLTEQGEESFRVSRQLFYDWDKQKLCALTEEERDTLLTLLRKIIWKEDETPHV